MAGFDPDAYLAKRPTAAPQAFDPDAYLAAVTAPSSGIPTGRAGVDQIPGYGGPVPASTAAPARPESGFFGKLLSPVETAIGLGTGLVTSPIVEASKIYGTLTSGKYGTQAGIRAGEATGRKVQQFFQPQYSPESETQQAAISNALASTGLQGVPINMMSNMATLARPAVQQVAPIIKAPLEARQQRIQTQRVKESELAAPRIDAAKDALELGLALDPSLSNPSVVTRLKTGAVGAAGLQGNLSKLNLPQVSKIARQDMGLPETIKLDAKAFETARNTPEISGAYDKVRAVPKVAGDETVLADIDKLRVAPMIGDTGQAASVNNFLDTVKGQLQAGTDGATAVQSIRQLRRDAQAIYNQQSAGVNPPSPEAIARADINMGVARALENAIENSITDPRLVTDFRNARTALARTYDYERATNLATGVIDPQALASLAAEGKPLSGKLAKIANVAANFPENMQGGVVREPSFKEKLTRSGAAGTGGAIVGSLFGLPGTIIGGAVGAAGGNTASALMARRMATPQYQRANAMPQDYRPIPSGLRPVEPNVPVNALAPYDYSQAAFTPPNFVMQPNQYPPRTTFVGPETGTPQLGMGREPVGGGQTAALRAEDARLRAMYEAQDLQAQAVAAQAEAAARKPATGGTPLVFDERGRLIPADQTLRGATPNIQVIESTGKNLSGAADILASGRSPALMSAEQKIAWEKTKVDLADIVPGMKALNDKAIASKMMDRQWVESAIVKAREKAIAFDEMAKRNTNAQIIREATIKREQMLDAVEALEAQLGAARPVQRGSQGPKTQAAQRNKNALAPEPEPTRIQLNNMAPGRP
jgi:hypothetical protein